MSIYGFPDEDKKEIVYEIDNNNSSRKSLPSGKWGSKFKVQDILDEGGILYIEPELKEGEKLGGVIIGENTYTTAVVIFTQEEIDAALLGKRNLMVCTLWQFRKAINATGKRGEVAAYLATASQDEKDGWEVVSRVERMHPNIDGMKNHFNMSDEDMDELFTLAVTL